MPFVKEPETTLEDTRQLFADSILEDLEDRLLGADVAATLKMMIYPHRVSFRVELGKHTASYSYWFEEFKNEPGLYDMLAPEEVSSKLLEMVLS
jgi:hypothetical protein